MLDTSTDSCCMSCRDNGSDPFLLHIPEFDAWATVALPGKPMEPPAPEANFGVPTSAAAGAIPLLLKSGTTAGPPGHLQLPRYKAIAKGPKGQWIVKFRREPCTWAVKEHLQRCTMLLQPVPAPRSMQMSISVNGALWCAKRLLHAVSQSLYCARGLFPGCQVSSDLSVRSQQLAEAFPTTIRKTIFRKLRAFARQRNEMRGQQRSEHLEDINNDSATSCTCSS